MSRSKLTYYVVASLVIFFGLHSAIQAQNQTIISIAPAITEIALEPGQSADTVLNLTNQSQDSMLITVDASSLVPEEQLIDSTKKSQFDVSQWIKLADTELSLEPAETKQVSVQIVVPDNAAPGSHYASVRFRSSLPDDSNSQVKVESELTALLFINLAGDIQENIEFLDISTKDYAVKGPIPISFRLANIGNSHSLVKNSLIIKKGETVAYKEDLKPEIILPNTKKTFETTWQADSYGSYSIQVVSQYGSDNIRIDSTNTPIFIGPPVAAIYVAAGILIVAFVVAKKKLHKKHSNKKLK